MAPFSLAEMSRPKTFLYVFSLRSGAELITMTILINKISGLYGILAILTGVHLSPLQLSMYLYSLFAVGVTLYLFSHIRRQSPLECLALAFFYAIDSIINAAYTATFAVAWFLVLANHLEDGTKAPGSSAINAAAGFTNPEQNTSHVDVHALPPSGIAPEQSTVTYGQGTAPSTSAGLSSALFQGGGLASITIICALWILRIYFIFVMLAFARSVLRQHIATTSNPSASWQPQTHEEQDGSLAENPFAESREEGQGYEGKLGRAMLRVAPQYWLGPDEDRDWVRGLGGKFNNRKNVEPAGVSERERRRRSGTGPPMPSIQLPRFQGQSDDDARRAVVNGS